MHLTASERGGEGLAHLTRAGVGVWLDGPARETMRSARLTALVEERGVVGVSISPSSLARGVVGTHAYTADIGRLSRSGAGADEVLLTLCADDVRAACDALLGRHEAGGGRDGWVAAPLDPRLADDGDATLLAAREVQALVDRPNVAIAIPATQQGVAALRDAVAEGISVVATHVVSLDRFRAVQAAYGEGLERAEYAGFALPTLTSFAGLPLAPLDVAADAWLDRIGGEAAAALRGRVAIANAVLAYQAFESRLTAPRWRDLAADGAVPQRPLWTHTEDEDSSYLPSRYVVELVAPRAAVALREETLVDVDDHAAVHGDTIHAVYAAAQSVLDDAERVGIAYTDLTDAVEEAVLAADVEAWQEALGRVAAARRA
jgi:transaldolase